jgi:hypothetical protein
MGLSDDKKGEKTDAETEDREKKLALVKDLAISALDSLQKIIRGNRMKRVLTRSYPPSITGNSFLFCLTLSIGFAHIVILFFLQKFVVFSKLSLY